MVKLAKNRFIPYDAGHGEWYVMDTTYQIFASNNQLGYGLHPVSYEESVKRAEKLNELAEMGKILSVSHL